MSFLRSICIVINYQIFLKCRIPVYKFSWSRCPWKRSSRPHCIICPKKLRELEHGSFNLMLPIIFLIKYGIQIRDTADQLLIYHYQTTGHSPVEVSIHIIIFSHHMPFILLNGNSPDFPTIKLLMQAVKLRNTSSDGQLPAAMYVTFQWHLCLLEAGTFNNTVEQKRGTKGVFNLKTGCISFIYKNDTNS